jgi:histidyl-tRNA synthetase
MGYADKNTIPIVIIAGSKEIESDSITIKKMMSGVQTTSSIDNLPSSISASLI